MLVAPEHRSHRLVSHQYGIASLAQSWLSFLEQPASQNFLIGRYLTDWTWLYTLSKLAATGASKCDFLAIINVLPNDPPEYRKGTYRRQHLLQGCPRPECAPLTAPANPNDGFSS